MGQTTLETKIVNGRIERTVTKLEDDGSETVVTSTIDVTPLHLRLADDFDTIFGSDKGREKVWP